MRHPPHLRLTLALDGGGQKGHAMVGAIADVMANAIGAAQMMHQDGGGKGRTRMPSEADNAPAWLSLACQGFLAHHPLLRLPLMLLALRLVAALGTPTLGASEGADLLVKAVRLLVLARTTRGLRGKAPGRSGRIVLRGGGDAHGCPASVASGPCLGRGRDHDTPAAGRPVVNFVVAFSVWPQIWRAPLVKAVRVLVLAATARGLRGGALRRSG